MAQVRAPQSAHGDERVLRLEPADLRHGARHRVRFVAHDQYPQLAQVEGTALRRVWVQPEEPRGEQSAVAVAPSFDPTVERRASPSLFLASGAGAALSRVPAAVTLLASGSAVGVVASEVWRV